MGGLLDQAGKLSSKLKDVAEESHKVWEESMLRNMQSLKDSILHKTPEQISLQCNAQIIGTTIRFNYWGDSISIDWPSLEMRGSDGEQLSTFDRAMLMYYLNTADGADLADRWIGFRELPNGGFYNQAFQKTADSGCCSKGPRKGLASTRKYQLKTEVEKEQA